MGYKNFLGTNSQQRKIINTFNQNTYGKNYISLLRPYLLTVSATFLIFNTLIYQYIKSALLYGPSFIWSLHRINFIFLALFHALH